MKKRKLLSIAAACTMCLTSVITTGWNVSAVSQTNDSSDVRIMALGDSITDGYWTSGGYRKYLYHELEEKGYTNIDMVGPKGGDSESFNYHGNYVTYDGNYAGYSGYAIQYITGTETRQGILETINGDYGNGKNMIEAYDPDVVLLQIGTNDILSNYNDGIADRLENLVDTILASMDGDGDMLYVSTIPDINVAERYDWLWSYGMSYSEDPEGFTAKVQGCIDAYNASIQTLVSEKQAAGERVAFADIHSVVDQNTDLNDGVHPNEQGYENMGLYWADLLDSTYLNGVVKPIEPAITTTATTQATTTTRATTTSTTSATTVESTITTTQATTQETTHAATTSDSVTSTAEMIILDDVTIGEWYDLLPYQNADVKAVSFVFTHMPQYGMNGCAAFGNWELSKNYTTEDITNNTLTVSLDKFYPAMILYKWYGETELDHVILYCGNAEAEGSTVSTVPETTTTTTTTTTTATTTTTKPTTTTITTTTTTMPTIITTTATTATKPITTTNTTTVTTTAKTAGVTTPTTTTPSSENTVVLTDVVFGESYSLADYDYASIEKIEITLGGDIGYGFGGSLVLGNWTVQTSYGHADMRQDGTIAFEVTNPQDRFTLFQYWGSMYLKSMTLYFK